MISKKILDVNPETFIETHSENKEFLNADIYPWQQTQWQTLWLARQQKRLPQALLLMGPTGLGKRHFAMQLAQALLCENQQEFACGACRSCQLLKAKSHPDLVLLELEEKSKAIKINQIRDLSAIVSQTAQCSQLQVVIINPADSMNIAAANALLKTLEEPMGTVVFILVGQQVGVLPATIISRCQILKFVCRDETAALDWLKKNKVSAPELLLKIANNAPLAAQSLHANNCLALRDQLLKQLLAMQNNQLQPLVMAKSLIELDSLLIVHLLQTIAIDLLRLQLKIENVLLTHHDQLQQLALLNRSIQLSVLLEFLQILQATRKRLLTAVSVNGQLLIESLILRCKVVLEGTC